MLSQQISTVDIIIGLYLQYLITYMKNLTLMPEPHQKGT